MSQLGSRARSYLADAVRSFERAPVEVALALFISLAFSYAIEADGDAMPTWLETVVSALLVLAFAWTGTMLHALGAWSARTRWLFTVAGALLVAAYAWFVLDFTREAESWRATALLAAAVLWLLALPALAGGGVERMRRVAGRILLRTMAVGLYGAALFAGLALALAAIDTLFELDLEGTIYGHVFGWIFFVLVPWVVLGGLDDYVRPVTGPEPVASAVHRLTLFLVPPLLAIYFLILYAYVVRIGITGEVPKNLVSPMVLAAGALTALALLLFDPQPRATAFERGLRATPVLLFALMPLGVWALLLRINQYGWTEPRALRLVALAGFTALAGVAIVQLVRRRAYALHVLPIALAVALVLAVLGPWNVLAMSRRNQQDRLEAALARVDTFPLAPAATAPQAPPARWRGELVRPDSVRTVPAELYQQVQTDARYLHTHFGEDALPPRLAALASHYADERWLDFAALLGLAAAPTPGAPGEMIARRLPESVPVELNGATLYRVEFYPAKERIPGGAVTVSADALRIVVRLGDLVLAGDLAPLAGAAGAPGELPPGASVVPLLGPGGEPAGELVVLDVSFGETRGRRVVQHLSGTLLLPRAAPR